MGALNTFLEMGGYAAYVWPGYGLAVIGMVGLLLVSLRTLRSREKEFAGVRRSRPDPGDIS